MYMKGSLEYQQDRKYTINAPLRVGEGSEEYLHNSSAVVLHFSLRIPKSFLFIWVISMGIHQIRVGNLLNINLEENETLKFNVNEILKMENSYVFPPKLRKVAVDYIFFKSF